MSFLKQKCVFFKIYPTLSLTKIEAALFARCSLLVTFCSLLVTFCWLLSVLVASVTIPEWEEIISHPAFMGICRTISRTCQPYLIYLVDGFFMLSFLVLIKETKTWSEFKISSCCFCVWCKSRELGVRESSRFSPVTPVVESFFSDLLRAVISYLAELHLESCQTYTTEASCENSQRL